MKLRFFALLKIFFTTFSAASNFNSYFSDITTKSDFKFLNITDINTMDNSNKLYSCNFKPDVIAKLDNVNILFAYPNKLFLSKLVKDEQGNEEFTSNSYLIANNTIGDILIAENFKTDYNTSNHTTKRDFVKSTFLSSIEINRFSNNDEFKGNNYSYYMDNDPHFDLEKDYTNRLLSRETENINRETLGLVNYEHTNHQTRQNPTESCEKSIKVLNYMNDINSFSNKSFSFNNDSSDCIIDKVISGEITKDEYNGKNIYCDYSDYHDENDITNCVNKLKNKFTCYDDLLKLIDDKIKNENYEIFDFTENLEPEYETFKVISNNSIICDSNSKAM